MNILVIGNGFDLAHGFPTTYKNFLEFTDVFKRYIPICKKEEIEPEEIHIKDREKVMFLHDLNKREQNIFEELENLLIDNIWINYFWEIYEARISIGKDGWIDFENEISKVVQTIDKVNREIQKSKREESEIKDISFYEKQLFELIELDINKVIGDGIEEYKTHLLRDLNRLIRGLEIYLAYYVERITPDTRIQDIEALDIQCVLSFNYTNTYEKWYCTDKEKKIAYDYIHGRINPKADENTSNLILGIDEYLLGEEKRTNNEFIEFKKFYQRIYKSTDSTYMKWVEQIKKYPEVNHNLFIFGHSLDKTDRDILKLLICNDNVTTKIYYYRKNKNDKKELGKLIKNLVRIMGQDELISRTMGEHKTIEFIPQTVFVAKNN